MINGYILPGWHFRRINWLPRAVIVWLCAFMACWPAALCLHYLSRLGDQSRVDKTLRDIELLAKAVAAGYATLPDERKLHADPIRIGVRQLIRTGDAPVSLFTPPGTDQPLGLVNAWGGRIENSIDPAGINIDLLYVPRRICTQLLRHAHTLEGIDYLTTNRTHRLAPPVSRTLSREACSGRPNIKLVFKAPTTGIRP